MPKTFAEHLAAAAAAPVDLPGFLAGYADVLREVAQEGRFHLHGLTLDAPRGVYSPHDASSTRFIMDRFFALGLDKPCGSLLEVGCGAGGISLLAARAGWTVSAGDIDPAAVAATQDNAALNWLTVAARVSDLFEAFKGQQFDAIVFNEPFFHLQREVGTEERTLSDFNGQLHIRFMRDAREHLRDGGSVVFSYANCSDPGLLNQPGWHLELRAFDFDAGANLSRAIFRATPA